MLVLVKVTHVTFLVIGRDDVPCLLLALASKRAASALRRVRLVLQIRSSLVRVENPSARVARVFTHSSSIICVITHTLVCQSLHVVW